MKIQVNDSLSPDIDNAQKVKLAVFLLVVALHAAMAALFSTINVPLKEEEKQVEPIQIELISLAPENLEALPPEVIKQTAPNSASATKTQPNSGRVGTDPKPKIDPKPESKAVQKTRTVPEKPMLKKPVLEEKVTPVKQKAPVNTEPDTQIPNQSKFTEIQKSSKNDDPAELPISTNTNLPDAITVNSSTRTTTVISPNSTDSGNDLSNNDNKSQIVGKDIEDKSTAGSGKGSGTGTGTGTGSGSGSGSGSGKGSSSGSGSVDPGPQQFSQGEANANWARKPNFNFDESVYKGAREGALYTLTVKLSVDKQGKITNTKLEEQSGHRPLDRAVLKALRQSKFKPFIRQGVPVSGWVTLLFEFNL